MPKRKDLKKILVIGAGPIIIGQACEFDYSGTQACKALKDEGYKVILINSNPATIMTDSGVADKTYIEPITLQVLEKIIIKEKPDAILPTMGGQTALNVRAVRRYKEYKKMGIKTTLGKVKSDIKKRDYEDTHRKISSLKPAKDAVLLDSSFYNTKAAFVEIDKVIRNIKYGMKTNHVEDNISKNKNLQRLVIVK